MKKLELKHFNIGDQAYGGSDIWTITGLTSVSVRIYNGGYAQNLPFGDFQTDYSLIKHPLSDLTKEIEIDGEKITPINMIKQYHGGGYSIEGMKLLLSNNPLNLNYRAVQKLLEWHFDIHNLIEKGLAIDINTLK